MRSRSSKGAHLGAMDVTPPPGHDVTRDMSPGTHYATPGTTHPGYVTRDTESYAPSGRPKHPSGRPGILSYAPSRQHHPQQVHPDIFVRVHNSDLLLLVRNFLPLLVHTPFLRNFLTLLVPIPRPFLRNCLPILVHIPRVGRPRVPRNKSWPAGRRESTVRTWVCWNEDCPGKYVGFLKKRGPAGIFPRKTWAPCSCWKTMAPLQICGCALRFVF